MKTRLADTISCFSIKRKQQKNWILIIALLVITAWNIGFCNHLFLKQKESGKWVEIRIQGFFFMRKGAQLTLRSWKVFS